MSLSIVNVATERSRTLMRSGPVRSEYVQTLNWRSKWQTPAEQHLKTVDLVWIVKETNPRGYYSIARIVQLRYGSDSVARSAVLRTSTGSLVRPLVKLEPVFPTSSTGPEELTK